MSNEEKIISDVIMSTECEKYIQQLKEAIRKEERKTIETLLKNIQQLFSYELSTKIIVRTTFGDEICSWGTVVSNISVEYPIDKEVFLQITVAPLTKKLKEISILFVGLHLAGKTSMLQSIQKGYFTPTRPTLGLNFFEIDYGKLQISVFDIGGQEVYQKLWDPQEWEEITIIVYVVDGADRESFIHSLNALETHILKSEGYRSTPIILVVNKQDLPTAVSPDKVTEIFQASSYAQDQEFITIGTSAKEGTGLAELMEKIHEISLERSNI
ncbi:MAG: ADP-ribosylation factor-like protein [Promethearchaeota archaeon]